LKKKQPKQQPLLKPLLRQPKKPLLKRLQRLKKQLKAKQGWAGALGFQPVLHPAHALSFSPDTHYRLDRRSLSWRCRLRKIQPC